MCDDVIYHRLSGMQDKAKNELSVKGDMSGYSASFIEIEQLVDQGDAEEIQEILFQFLESLGVTRNARVTKGYDVLLYEQQKK